MKFEPNILFTTSNVIYMVESDEGHCGPVRVIAETEDVEKFLL